MRAGLFCILLMSTFVASNSVNADPAVQVFECNINGQRVFSDHACGDDAVQRDIEVANRMDAVKVSSHSASKEKTPRSSRKHSEAGNDDHDKRRQQCARIQKSRDSLHDKMRAGYTAKQDERLHDRLRKLNDDYFQLRCSGVH